MKTLIKQVTICAMLAFGISAQAADYVLGSWQNTTGDGWTDSSDVSITNAANMPAKYEFETGVVAGYAKSLGIHETGFGNARLKFNITTLGSTAVAAFTNGTKMQFTFSCPPDSGAGAGYMQLVQFQYNSPGSGFQNISSGWTGNGFSATGDTGNNSGGQPIFYFYASSPARSQVVTWDYSAVKSNIMSAGISYLQLTFVFQTGSGAPTNVLMNDVKIIDSSIPAGTIVVDDFNPAGVGSSNPINYDRYATNQSYASGQITNVYAKWFGDALSSVTWNSTVDAGGYPGVGSLQVNLNWSGGSQFVAWDQGSPNNFFALSSLGINGTQYTNFQCDVKFAPGSVSAQGSFSQPIFGHLRFGHRTETYSQDWFAAVDVPATNTGWVHVSAPLSAISDSTLTNMGGFIFGIDSGFYGLNFSSGTSTLYIDNIKFVGPTDTVVVAPPTLAIQKSTPGLRIFAGSPVNTYDRAQLATTDSSQSWVGGSYPVSYSFSLLSYPANINQTHLFIVPVNTSGQANMGNAGTANEYIDYQATNMLGLYISPGPTAGSAVASVQWKTNPPNANPDHTALMITNSTAIGTWTLTFNSVSTGTLTAPGASPVAFTITDPNVSTHFANPAVAYFGLQPNSAAGIGQYEDWGFISVSGVAGTQENENFTTESSFNPNNYWANNSGPTGTPYPCLQFVPASAPYWVNWSLPAGGYQLGTAMSITGNTNTSGYPWVLPEYYNNYNDGLYVPGASTQGTNTWVLIPTNCLPTVDGTVGGPVAPNAFFRLVNPPLAN